MYAKLMVEHPNHALLRAECERTIKALDLSPGQYELYIDGDGIEPFYTDADVQEYGNMLISGLECEIADLKRELAALKGEQVAKAKADVVIQGFIAECKEAKP
jgi:hypothetical protein